MILIVHFGVGRYRVPNRESRGKGAKTVSHAFPKARSTVPLEYEGLTDNDGQPLLPSLPTKTVASQLGGGKGGHRIAFAFLRLKAARGAAVAPRTSVSIHQNSLRLESRAVFVSTLTSPKTWRWNTKTLSGQSLKRRVTTLWTGSPWGHVLFLGWCKRIKYLLVVSYKTRPHCCIICFSNRNKTAQSVKKINVGSLFMYTKYTIYIYRCEDTRATKHRTVASTAA